MLLVISGLGMVSSQSAVTLWGSHSAAATAVVVAVVVVDVCHVVVVNDADLPAIVIVTVADVTVSWPRPSATDSAHLTTGQLMLG